MELNSVSGHIVDSAIRVHSELGPGLLESTYKVCMIHELRKRNLIVRSEVEQPVHYDGIVIDVGYRIDLLVEDLVIVELKSVDKLIPIHKAQLLSYLKLSRKKVGLLLNFNIERMKTIVGAGNCLTSRADLAVYECDGFTIDKNKPDVVVFPMSAEDVVAIVKACNELDVPFVARGAGTSLAGGCVPVGGGVMIGLSRMKKILEVNVRDRYALVEAGVVNVWLTNQLKPLGYHYAPDPSSQGACTIGGNVATNSGRWHRGPAAL